MGTLRAVEMCSLVEQVSAAGRAAAIPEEIAALRCVPGSFAAQAIAESASR